MNLESVVAPLADRPGTVWLDGGATSWSIASWDPEDVFTAADWASGGRARVRPHGGGPFAGGVLGALAYPGAGPDPSVWLGRFAGGIAFHPEHGLHIGGSPGFQADARRRISEAVPLPPPLPPRPPASVTTWDRVAYEAAFHRIQGLLAAGDCYQVNLTRAVHARGVGPPSFDAWRRLRARSDAPFGAWIRLDRDRAILSNSPELLLRVTGRSALSEPIKGTRPHVAERAVALAAELERSPKERAELAMIVDLVRNDLGRVAVVGGVRTAPREIRAHATVIHASQRVEADLRPDVDGWDALAALFPAGSVTGAPKLRAMQRIAELEPEPRGLYCGAIGWAADGGDMAWSVAIRTAIWTGDDLRFHVGGGIVIGADCAAEWEETEHKGRALREALLG
jgi:para-aminobenzoate synthetase component 1